MERDKGAQKNKKEIFVVQKYKKLTAEKLWEKNNCLIIFTRILINKCYFLS